MNKNIIRFYSEKLNRENNINRLLDNNNDKEKIEVIINNIKELQNLENKQGIVLENYKKSCKDFINSVENKKSGINPYEIIEFLQKIEKYNSINDNLLLDSNYVNIDNTDYIENKNMNSLSLYYNLISDKLVNMLNKGFMKKIDSPNNENSFYMVVFNVINNKGEKILIYNYRKYHKIFLDCFLSFIIIEHMSQIINFDSNIGNGLFFILDDKLKNNILYDRLLEEEINKNRNFRFYLGYNIIDLLKLLFKGELISLNINDISYLIKLVETLKIYEFIDMLSKYNDMDMYKYNIVVKSEIMNKKYIHNILSRFILVVSDLDDLLKNLKSLGYKEVNQGPQKFRGSGSYINYILTCLDNNFRYSMYIHNLNHNRNPISRNKFSYKNIHMNICGVR